jgi:hypothetical protein
MIALVPSTAAPYSRLPRPSGDAHDEQLARRLVEGQFRRDPCVGATEDGGERRLAQRAGGAVGGEVALVQLAGDVAGIALEQARERGVRRVDRAGRLRLSPADKRCRRQGGDAGSEHKTTGHSGSKTRSAHTHTLLHVDKAGVN